ncbi:MAG TPA: hypothetical protein VMI52_09965 [Acetobacteraceae bacterium]|nr:hypothetical protein [Acetobacteraceae bacterium]
MAEAYIMAAARTAGGRRDGWLPADRGGEILDSLIKRSGADLVLVENVVLGCVGQAGEQVRRHAGRHQGR